MTAAAMMAAVLWTVAALPAMAAPPKVNETVFEWVQSSSRANYYFNKQQICYAVDDKGKIDLNTLIVPTLKTYDDVQIQDIKDKRRWKMLPMVHIAKAEPHDGYVEFQTDLQVPAEVRQMLVNILLKG